MQYLPFSSFPHKQLSSIRTLNKIYAAISFGHYTKQIENGSQIIFYKLQHIWLIEETRETKVTQVLIDIVIYTLNQFSRMHLGLVYCHAYLHMHVQFQSLKLFYKILKLLGQQHIRQSTTLRILQFTYPLWTHTGYAQQCTFCSREICCNNAGNVRLNVPAVFV